MNIKIARFGALAVSLALFAVGCDTGPKSAAGFRLPDGNAEVGEQVFVALACNDCHTVKGTSIERTQSAETVSVELGGAVSRVKTYGELVSSVINPSHKITRRYPADEVSQDGESLMRAYNETMTVQQLVDLVAFLQARYEVIVPQYVYPHF